MLIENPDNAEEVVKDTPQWVSERNLSMRVWRALVQLEEEKSAQIGAIRDRNANIGKRVATISKRNIAKYADCSPSSLHNRVFSAGLQTSLAAAKRRLQEKLDKRLEQLASVGRKDRRKSEILTELRETSRQLREVEVRQISEVVDKVFERLPLRVRRRLMLD